MRRATLTLGLIALVASTIAAPRPAHAQSYDGYRIDRLRPPPTVGDGLAMPLPRTVGDLVPAFGLVLEYGHEPLVARSAFGGPRTPVVSSRVVAHVLAALGITDRVELHLRVPVAFSAGSAPTVGEATLAAPDVVTVADPALGGSVRLLGESEDGFNLGVMAEVLFPLTDASGYASDREVSARGMLTLSAALPAMTIALAAGASYRPERQLLGSGRSASELDVALGLRVPAFVGTDLMVEVLLSSGLREDLIFQSRGTSLEVVAGGRYRFDNGLAIELGAAMGFLRAPGTPAFRVFLGVRWALPPAPPADLDHDGFVGDADSCPSEAEDRDQWYDEDGCPDPDDDEDGIPDAQDSCPRDAEDADGWDDDDGCLDPDNDGDGWADADDACRFIPGGDSARGCPRTLRVEGTTLVLLQDLVFSEGTAQLLPIDGIVLDEIAGVMNADRGGVRWALRVRPIRLSRRDDGVALADARAAAIRDSLVARDVPAIRVVVVPAQPPAEDAPDDAPLVTLVPWTGGAPP